MRCLEQPTLMGKTLPVEYNWNDLYTFLRSYVPRIVRTFHFTLWRGQEEDVIEDVIQETLRRITERMYRVQRGEAEAILSLERMSIRIAMNYCRDIIRRDSRLVRMQAYEPVAYNEMSSGLDIATENVYRRELFILLAQEVNLFPRKQRTALLMDLAYRMSFDKRPTPLQEAFLAVGIHLEEYKKYTVDHSEERKKHAALLAHAYKRIEKLVQIQNYAEARKLS